ncbi:MAG TPA: DUF3783 domain-containing protein [Deltaproteobacteria bacterium]|nr:DUF3783 domain-containing protein [Deltaproteobacteria bacterium]
MDLGPCVLLWNYSVEEILKIDQFFQEIGAPQACVIEIDQGHLLVHEILFTDKRSREEFACDEKIMLFYNTPADMVHTIMSKTKNTDLPRPIYAMITEQSIEWKFSYLAGHLIKERDFFMKKKKQQAYSER